MVKLQWCILKTTSNPDNHSNKSINAVTPHKNNDIHNSSKAIKKKTKLFTV